MSNIAVSGSGSPSSGFMVPHTIEEAKALAASLCNSDLVPKEYRRNPDNALVAMAMGSDIGLGPVQSLQNIAVINGKPTLYGDGLAAVVLGSALCEQFEEGYDEQKQVAWCKVKRSGRKPRLQTFSMEEAKQAGLLGKQGPWSQYPKRMCKMRARGWALRDEFADVLLGLTQIRLVDSDTSTVSFSDVPESESVPDTETFDVTTGEIIDVQPETAPEPDKIAPEDIVTDESVMAAKMIKESISDANQPEALMAIKKEIVELPKPLQAPLIDLWRQQKQAITVDQAS